MSALISQFATLLYFPIFVKSREALALICVLTQHFMKNVEHGVLLSSSTSIPVLKLTFPLSKEFQSLDCAVRGDL